MDRLMQSLCEAYELLKLIPVSGENVDRMYAVRAELRVAYQIAKAIKKENEERERTEDNA